MMAVDWKKCSSTEFSMLTMKCKAKLSQQLANLTMVLYSIAVILYSSDVLVRLNVSRTSNITVRPLILKMEIPFDSNKRFIYESVVIISFFHLFMCSCAIGSINVLLINLVSTTLFPRYYNCHIAIVQKIF